MWVFFSGGRQVWFQAAKTWEIDGNSLRVLATRGRLIAVVRLDTVETWFFDTEEVDWKKT